MKKITLLLLILIPSILFAQRNVELKYRYIPSIKSLSLLPTYSKKDFDMSLHIVLKDRSDNFYNTHTFYYIGGEVNSAIKSYTYPKKITVYVPDQLDLNLIITSWIGFGSGIGFINEIDFNQETNLFIYLHNKLSGEFVSEHATLGLALIFGFYSNKWEFENTREILSFKGLSAEINLGIFI